MMPLLLLLLACPKTETSAAAPAPAAAASAEPTAPVKPAVMLDGARTEVRWDDGDTFEVGDQGYRMAGFNTLESYGPVHRWGEFTGQDLYRVAKAAGDLARSQVWTCTTLPGEGGYGRKVADCPDLREAMLRSGHAHVYAVDSVADPAHLAMQAEAQAKKLGMWAKGVPEGIVTSLHSLDEKPGQTSTYDRVITVATGASTQHDHTNVYQPCQEVCYEGSCMTYIPFKQRYGENRLQCH